MQGASHNTALSGQLGGCRRWLRTDPSCDCSRRVRSRNSLPPTTLFPTAHMEQQMVSKYMTSDGYNKQMVGEQGPRSISGNLDQLADDSPTQIRGKYITGTPRQPFPQELKALSDKSRARILPCVFLQLYTGGQQTFTQRLAPHLFLTSAINRCCWDSINCPSSRADAC